MSTDTQIIRTGCPAHNCGGRCLMRAHVVDGVIVRLETDDRPDSIADPQLRACVKGRAYLRRQYHPDRLQYPLKRSVLVSRSWPLHFLPLFWLVSRPVSCGRIETAHIHRHHDFE